MHLTSSPPTTSSGWLVPILTPTVPRIQNISFSFRHCASGAFPVRNPDIHGTLQRPRHGIMYMTIFSPRSHLHAQCLNRRESRCHNNGKTKLWIYIWSRSLRTCLLRLQRIIFTILLESSNLRSYRPTWFRHSSVAYNYMDFTGRGSLSMQYICP